MNQSSGDGHLSKIQTLWTLVHKANDQADTSKPDGQTKQDALTKQDAQSKLLERYSGAVYRYLLGALRDEHAADELFQEFALRFVQGKMRKASKDKGRFRDYMKTILFNLINSHFSKRKHQPKQADSLVLQGASSNEPPPEEQVDEAFRKRWCEEILACTWKGLAEMERESGSLYYTLLRYKSENPQVDSTKMAEVLAPVVGKALNASSVRQTVHRAREKFAELLLEEVSRSLETEDLEAIEQEVVILGLHSYCADAIKKRRTGK